MKDMMSAAETAGRTLSVNERLVAVHGPEELERAFSMIGQEHAEAIIIFPSPMFFAARKRIVELASRYRLPAMAMDKEFVTLGVLMAYGASIADLIRRCTSYVDKILKGANPTLCYRDSTPLVAP
jgi:putative tryptophan/tyrosine transport system substrate-binding protein